MARRTTDRRVDSEESGFSITEVAFAMAVMLVVMMMGLRASSGLLKVETAAVGKGEATLQVTGALNELRQEIISANVLFDPASDHTAGGVNYAGTNPDGSQIAAGWSLRIYTQVGGNPMCAQWRLLATGVLQTRTWSDLWSQTDGESGVVHPWSTVAAGIFNPGNAVPFVLDPGQNYGGSASSRLLDLDLYVSPAGTVSTAQPMQSSIAARNAEYYPANTGDCYPVPPS
jgi:hypothetical protein